jgi:hypothetical protein
MRNIIICYDGTGNEISENICNVLEFICPLGCSSKRDFFVSSLRERGHEEVDDYSNSYGTNGTYR